MVVRFIKGGWFFLAFGLVLQLSRSGRDEGFDWQDWGALGLLVIGILLFVWYRPSDESDPEGDE